MDIKIRDGVLTSEKDRELILKMVREFSDENSSSVKFDDTAKDIMIDNLCNFPGSVIFIAEKDGQCAGIAICFEGFSTFKGRKLINIHDLFVSKNYQGQGIGTALLEHIENEAVTRGYCKITLEVYQRNASALKLYEKQGFIGSKGNDVSFFMQKETT